MLAWMPGRWTSGMTLGCAHRVRKDLLLDLNETLKDLWLIWNWVLHGFQLEWNWDWTWKDLALWTRDWSNKDDSLGWKLDIWKDQVLIWKGSNICRYPVGTLVCTTDSIKIPIPSFSSIVRQRLKYYKFPGDTLHKSSRPVFPAFKEHNSVP